MFTLRALILFTVMLASMLGILMHPYSWEAGWEPLTLEESIAIRDRVQRGSTTNKDVMLTPDGTRNFKTVTIPFPNPSYGGPKDIPGIYDLNTNKLLYDLTAVLGTRKAGGFLDNDRFFMYEYKQNGDEVIFTYHIAYRRFPEWWWGIFYRPFFWTAFISFVLFIADLIKFSRKRRALHLQAPATS